MSDLRTAFRPADWDGSLITGLRKGAFYETEWEGIWSFGFHGQIEISFVRWAARQFGHVQGYMATTGSYADEFCCTGNSHRLPQPHFTEQSRYRRKAGISFTKRHIRCIHDYSSDAGNVGGGADR